MFLSSRSSRRRWKEAENARRNRLEIVRALSQGQVTRRELLKMGVVTAGGVLVLTNGLSPFARSAFADGIPTGTPASPVPPGLEFTQPLARLEILDQRAVSALDPAPTREANTTFNAAKGIGPVEGRPPGPDWAHQRFDEFFPKEAYEVFTQPVRGFRFHPALPEQRPDKVWTYDDSGFPLKLFRVRYGEPVLFRHHNALPLNPAENGGFGRNELTTHLHNAHTPAESDGFTGAFFFPGQFYDYRWPNALAGHDTINRDAADPRAGGPTDDGGIHRIPGDWRETLSSLWFHDHRFEFTAQNVYKGLAGDLNLYSAVDRGNEEIDDGVNLRLPSGTALPWGNVDYDVNLVIEGKALDPEGQLFFDIFDFDGFLGDVMTVNFRYKPFFEVERRKYRFRILNADASRFLKLALSDGSPIVMIGNDGNLMARPVALRELDEQGTGERYDVVIDFSRFRAGDKVWLVNLAEHKDGRKPAEMLSLAEALFGGSDDPGVGKLLEFRVARDPARPDVSRVPAELIPLPDMPPAVRERHFQFGRSGGTDRAPWTIKVDGSEGLAAAVDRVAALPQQGTAEIWRLENGGGGWDHPIHIHFEEGRILARDRRPVPLHEAVARKDLYRLGPGGELTVYLQFRDFVGTFMQHCHNTVHEDHAMLMRWDLTRGVQLFPTPIPTPEGVTFRDPVIVREAL